MTSKHKQAPLEFVREDDYVEYFLYPDVSNCDTEEDIEKILTQINSIVAEYAKDYIWHKDSFNIRLKCKDENSVLENTLLKNMKLAQEITKEPFFHGVTHFGENIQDEWFIVALILELTKCFKGLIGRVFDSDGEFLIIEAANQLPDYADINIEGKVLIFNGLVHICYDSSFEKNNECSLDETLAKLRTNSSKYCISNAAFECIQDRIRQFPQNIRENHHTATIYVPIAVASILKHRPNFIAQAVLAFCNRDMIDQKVLRAMRFFPPEERVYTNVKFTKCLYAMLMHNNFVPDRHTGWNLPATNTTEHRSHLLGIKVACGFEILASQSSKSKDLNTDKNWIKYLENLKETNYFQSLLEGSKDYVKLLERAEQYYREFFDIENTTSVVRQEIHKMIRNVDQDKTDLIHSQKSLSAEDSDAWLTISSKELDEILEKRYGQTSIVYNSQSAAGDSKSLSHIISEFLEQKTDYVGAETESTSKNSSDQKLSTKVKSNKKKQRGNIEFNPDEFQNAMQNLLDLAIPEDKWDSNSDMSDYDNDDNLERDFENMSNTNNMAKFEFGKYMNEMDRELAKTTIGSSFEKQNVKKAFVDDFEDIEDFQPVDIDVNTIKNMMKSYKAQMGTPGPASTLLGSLGVKLDEKGQVIEAATELKDTTV